MFWPATNVGVNGGIQVVHDVCRGAKDADTESVSALRMIRLCMTLIAGGIEGSTVLVRW